MAPCINVSTFRVSCCLHPQSVLELIYQSLVPKMLHILEENFPCMSLLKHHILDFYTRVGTLIVATIYLQLIQNRYMFGSFTVLQCTHQHCVQPLASDVEVVGYL